MKINSNQFFRVSILALLLCSHEVDAVTLPLNIKVRRVFGIASHLLEERGPLLIGSAVPIVYERKRHIVDTVKQIDIKDKHCVVGSLFNLRYVPSKKWWLEFTTAFEKETVCERGTTNLHDSRTALDDIVFSGGYNFFPSDEAQCTLYGIGSIPTKKSVTIQETFDTLVGTRFYSLGAGAEYSYGFINTPEHSLTGIIQARFLHFFSRHWFPILPRDAKIQPGNATDLLISGQYRWGLSIFEMGYNPTFFTNQAVLLKTGEILGPNFVRNSAYATLSHAWKDFPGLHRPTLLGTGLSIARSKRFDAKFVTWWVNFTTLF
jgi:hypothetical protein